MMDVNENYELHDEETACVNWCSKLRLPWTHLPRISPISDKNYGPNHLYLLYTHSHLSGPIGVRIWSRGSPSPILMKLIFSETNMS